MPRSKAVCFKGDDLPMELPMIGRDKELNRCRDLLQNAARGNGSTIIVSGQAGIGKTRFIKELIKEGVDAGMAVYETRCHQNSSTNFGPFLDIMKQLESDLYTRSSGLGEKQTDATNNVR